MLNKAIPTDGYAEMEEAEREEIENAMDERITDRERDRRTLNDDVYSDSEDEGDGRRDHQDYKYSRAANNGSANSLLHDFSKSSSMDDLQQQSAQDSMEVDHL
jgi:hypothetical protein